MSSLKWSTSHAVWITDIDDEHAEIFAAVADLQKALSGGAGPADSRQRLEKLIAALAGHCAHEERLMRAARYPSLRWHKQLHDAARRNAQQFAARLEAGDASAAMEAVEYLKRWLHGHTRVADRMMGSFLRNQLRCLGKLTFQAGTKPAGACSWVDTRGEVFDPRASNKRR